MQLVHRIPSFYFYTWCQFAASDRQYWIFASHSGFVGDYPVVHVDYCHCALILRVASKRSFVALGYHGWGSAPCSTFEAKTVSLTDKNFSCRQSGHKWIDALPKSNLSIVGNVLLIAHAFAMPVFFLIRHNQNYG